jgi:hypothetical protein
MIAHSGVPLRWARLTSSAKRSCRNGDRQSGKLRTQGAFDPRLRSTSKRVGEEACDDTQAVGDDLVDAAGFRRNHLQCSDGAVFAVQWDQQH